MGLEKILANQLAFLIKQRQEDEATVLAQVFRAGVESLYREALIEAYLLGEIPREKMVEEIGLDRLAEVEFERDALRRDVEWGLRGA